MRLFIGVELEDDVKAAAERVAATLRGKLADTVPHLRAGWVKTENLHITLWFIGEVPDPRGTEIAGALQVSPFPVPAFDLSFADLGAFPATGPPRVFWIGVSRGGPQMTALYGEIGRRLAALGFEPERRGYSAHLTIARVKDAGRGTSRLVRQALSAIDADCGTSHVTAVTLFRSRLSPRGATYEPLLRVPLS